MSTGESLLGCCSSRLEAPCRRGRNVCRGEGRQCAFRPVVVRSVRRLRSRRYRVRNAVWAPPPHHRTHDCALVARYGAQGRKLALSDCNSSGRRVTPIVVPRAVLHTEKSESISVSCERRGCTAAQDLPDLCNIGLQARDLFLHTSGDGQVHLNPFVDARDWTLSAFRSLVPCAEELTSAVTQFVIQVDPCAYQQRRRAVHESNAGTV